MGTNGPAVGSSAAAHAERIRAGEVARAGRAQPSSAPTTAERYAARILPGYHADEELREAARLSELRARGVITPDPEPEDLEDEFDEEELESEEDEEDAPLSTAERYAAVEVKRRAAEHEANLVAHKSAGQQAVPQVRYRYAAQLSQPHRYADRWGQKPAS
jgi:hypothetical protein